MRKIKVRRRGNSLGIGIFRLSLRLFGVQPTYGLLYIVCLHYLLFDRVAVTAAFAYVEKRFRKASMFKKYVHVYLLFVSQGKQLIDRHAIVHSKKEFTIDTVGYTQFLSLIKDAEKGVVLLTSHAGNWQVAMSTLGNIGKTVHLVMREEDNEALKRSLRVSDEQHDIKLISPEKELGGVFDILSVLHSGDVVSIMGDRSYDFNTVAVQFLNEQAYFPYGAFTIAAAARCPVVILLTAKTGVHEYTIDFSNVIYPEYVQRNEKQKHLKQWVQEYVTVLESFVKDHPYQSFLFYDVWKEHKKETIA